MTTFSTIVMRLLQIVATIRALRGAPRANRDSDSDGLGYSGCWCRFSSGTCRNTPAGAGTAITGCSRTGRGVGWNISGTNGDWSLVVPTRLGKKLFRDCVGNRRSMSDSTKVGALEIPNS